MKCRVSWKIKTGGRWKNGNCGRDGGMSGAAARTKYLEEKADKKYK